MERPVKPVVLHATAQLRNAGVRSYAPVVRPCQDAVPAGPARHGFVRVRAVALAAAALAAAAAALAAAAAMAARVRIDRPVWPLPRHQG